MGRDIKQLHPRLQQKIAELKQMCSGEGLILGIGECFRSVAEQDALYAQGRTAPGSVVTNAPGSSYSSQHQWGIAFDFFKNVSGHAYDDIAFFDRVGALGKSIGLGWGGDWTSPVDKPHLYLPDWGSTPARLKQQYGTFEAFRSTWSAGGTSGGSPGSAGGSSSGSASSASAYSFQTPTIRLGSTGIAVLLLQEILLPRGFYRGTLDRSFGNQTREAVRSYQISRNGASGAADGIVGSTTWADLLGLSASGGKYAPEVVKKGSRGASVLLVQEILHARGIYQGELDWIFGTQTEAAVIAYQKSRNGGAGPVDGIVGKKCWKDMIAL